MTLAKWLALMLLSGVATLAAAAADHDRDYAEALAQIAAASSAPTAPAMARQFGRGGVPKRSAADAGERLQALLDAHWTWLMRRYPAWATYTGFPGQNHRWHDPSVASRAQEEELQQRTLEVARSIDRKALSAAEQLNLELFVYERAIEVAGHPFPDELILVTPMYGIHTSMARTLASMPLFDAGQLDDYLARLRGIPQLLQGATATLREGLRQGITPPQVSLAKVPAQAWGLIPEQAADSPLLKPLDGAAAPAELVAPVRAQAQQVYREKLVPAVRAFATFLEEEYLPGAVKQTGLSKLPNGSNWYAWRARKMTTTDMTPQQIHELGLAEVERIRREMYAVMRQAGYDKPDIRGFAAKLAQDPAQFYTDPEHMLRDYRALAKRADAQVVKLFGTYPTLPYGVEAIPAHEAAGRSGAYYMPGSAEAGRPGIFYVNTSRLAETPKYEMQALLLHEGVPGHHFQLALAQDQGDLPDFRRHGGFTAYIEGWGLYAETLGEDFGFYQAPEDRFGALTYEMWRAIRLVVDTGMHVLGWSRQQAIDYFVQNTGRGMHRITAEVDRYLVTPGQALAYKLGQLRIQALREQAAGALGDGFDLRAFHDFILGEGALPLQVLQRRAQAWIEKQATESS